MHEEEQNVVQPEPIDWDKVFVVDNNADDEEVKPEKKVHIEDLDSMESEQKKQLLDQLKQTKEKIETHQAIASLVDKYLDHVYGNHDDFGRLIGYITLSEQTTAKKDAQFENYILNFCDGNVESCQALMSYIRNKAKAYLENEKTRPSSEAQELMEYAEMFNTIPELKKPKR